MKTQDIDNAPPSPWIPETDPLNLAVLGKASEECSELSKILARCIIQGIEASHPETGEPNRAELQDELDDVETMLHIVRERFNIPRSTTRQHAKLRYQDKWHESLKALSV